MFSRLRRAAAKQPRLNHVHLSFESLEDRSLPAPFTPGNLVIYRVGDGSAGLTNAATAVFLDEYKPDGTLVQSFALPTADSGANQMLTSSGTANSEGLLTLSTDGRYLLLTGYDAAVGTANVATSGSASVNRVVGRVDGDGNIDTSTRTTSFTGVNIRGAASTDGTDIWMTGAASGVIYTTLGGSGSGTAVSTTFTNIRAIAIFDSQLYVSSGTTGLRMGTVGSGTPTTSGQAITPLPGFPTSGGSPYGFYFADLDAGVTGLDTLYVADDGGTIQKYALVSGSWTAKGTISVSSVRGLTGVVNGGNVTLYGTNGTTFVSLTDTSGYNANITGTVTTLATASTNTAFRGIAFAPAAPSAGTPSINNATTNEDTQTTSGLVITANNASDDATTHYKITNITNGTLFKNNGTTPINNGDFITKAEGAAGLKFTPDANEFGTSGFSFDVQASKTNSDSGLGGSVVTATITVNAVADTPSVTDATTEVNTQTTNGLVISRNPVDGAEVTHFKITNITNGKLFLNDGTTLINAGNFITFAQANAGLRFTPDADFAGTGSFDVRASVSDSDAGLGGNTVTASITVTAKLTPSVTNATTNEDTQTSSGLVITNNADDAGATTHYKITSISNGTLFKNNGTTPINDGDFITKAEGAAGLKFTPDENEFGASGFRFDVQASTSNSDSGLGGNAITAMITVNAVADTPSVTNATTNEDTQTTSGLVISRNAVDGGEVTHFKITNIQNGTLFLNNGSTQVSDGDFITFAQANAGLRFTPNANLNDTTSTFSFGVQASTSASNAGLGGSVVTATINVNAVNDEPSFSIGADVTVDEDSGSYSQDNFASSFNPGGGADESGQSVLSYNVSNNNNGLFSGQPAIDVNGRLTFELAANASGVAIVTVQVVDSGGTAFGGDNTSQPLTFTITVNAVADTPSVTSATTNEDAQTTTGLVISRNAADGMEVTHFKITNIQNGTLFQHDGTTVINNGAFITFAQANAGLKFTPDMDLNSITSTFSFDVQASTSDSDGGLGGSIATATITVNAVNDKPSVTVGADITVDEDSGAFSQDNFASFAPGGGTDEAGQTPTYIVTNNNNALFSSQPVIDANGQLTFVPAANSFGTAIVTVRVTDDGGTNFGGEDTSQDVTFTITVNAVADTPSVSNTTTNEDTQSTSGLVISRNVNDGVEVTHFKITNIVNGTLFQNDGMTVINDGDFITFAQANAGLKFTPASNYFGTGSFDVQASTSNSDAGLGGNVVTATITVNAVADTPSVTSALTNEDTQTTSGIVISRNAADGMEVTHFKITNIQNGTLFQHDGTTVINNGAFITFAQANAGLKFTPDMDLNSITSTFSFDVQASTSDSDGGLGGSIATATITANAVNDEPSVTLAGDVVVTQDSGPTILNSFASFAPGGGTDEAGQVPTYNVTNNNNSLFSSQPAIDANGQLTFTPAPGASGTATVTVSVTDDGGTDFGGDDTSADVTFTITVSAVVVVQPVPLPAPVSTAASAQFLAIGSDAGELARVRQLDAKTGTLVREIVPFAGYTGGIKVAVGDVTGDTVDDVIVATSTGSSHVKVFDGATGAEVRSFFAFAGYPGGLSLATGDLNGDGRADIIVGTATGTTHVMAFSGLDGSVLQSFFAFPGFPGGVRVAAGDVTGDTRADIIAVAGPGGNGHVKAFDGTTGALVSSFFTYVGHTGEVNVAAGDINGDRKAEIVTVAQNARFGAHVQVFTSQAEIVRSFFAPTTIGMTVGASRTEQIAIVANQAPRIAVADIDGDNFADILLADPPGTGSSKVLMLNGATSGIMQNQNAFDPLFGFGVFVGA